MNGGQLFRPEAQQHYAESGAAESAPHVLAASSPRLTAAITGLTALVAAVLTVVPAPAHRLFDATYDPAGRSLVTCLPFSELDRVTDVRVVLGADPGLRLDPRAVAPAPACAADAPGTRWERVTLPDPLPPGGVRVRAELSAPLWCVVVAPCD